VVAVSLEVARGETVWLRGWNGSGKTTLLRLVARAISPTFGGGTVLGFDLQPGRAALAGLFDAAPPDAGRREGTGLGVLTTEVGSATRRMILM